MTASPRHAMQSRQAARVSSKQAIECELDGGEGGVGSSFVEALAVTVSADHSTVTDRVWTGWGWGWRQA
eukprot:529284-Rhodomonas_salina.2